MIYIENLNFGYQKKREVFSGLNLSLTGGHIYGLLGKNGAGKTTLLKLIGGLLFPLRGRIEVCDAIPRLRKPSFLSDIFFIPEEICLPDMKMKDYFPLICRFYPKFDEELLFHAMEIFEVSESDKMGQMSYGQRKKALISLGIACNTRLLMMDEPTNGLDIPSKSQFRRLIASVASEERCVVISTHQVRDLENLIDALVIIEKSRILVNTTIEQITDHFVFRQLREGETALFAEESLRGRWGMVPNLQQEDSKLDMELFFNAVLEHPAEVSDFIQYYKGVYRQLFWGLYGLFALVVALHSLRDFVVKDKILNTLLLPASVFEKYVLAFLNSTVVLLVVYLLMFYALASITNSYKFTGLNRLEYVSGSFGNQVPAMTPGQEVVHTEIGNVFDFSEGGYLMNISYDQKELNYGKLTNGIVVNMVVIWFLYVMSVGMWGSVTFRKHPFILTFLVHVIFLLALVTVSVWLGNKLFGAEPQMKPDELSFYGGEVLPDLPSFRWLLVFYIFPLTYQAVIWIKLKTKQVQ